MKTNIFSFRRMGLLFQRYFTERFRSELIYWCIMAIVFMFLRNSIPAISGLILVAGAFYAARFSREIHHPSNGIAYFMIPATQLEKMTVTIVVTLFYYFAMMIIVYVIGNLAGTFLNNMMANIDFLRDSLNINIFHHSSLQWKLFEEVPKLPDVFGIDYIQWIAFLLFIFLVSQSFFLLGGIYFKKNQALKTFAAYMIISWVLGYFFLTVVILIFGNDFPVGEDVEPWGRMVLSTLKIFGTLLPMYFWVVSYFRLTEKQV